MRNPSEGLRNETDNIVEALNDASTRLVDAADGPAQFKFMDQVGGSGDVVDKFALPRTKNSSRACLASAQHQLRNDFRRLKGYRIVLMGCDN